MLLLSENETFWKGNLQEVRENDCNHDNHHNNGHQVKFHRHLQKEQGARQI